MALKRSKRPDIYNIVSDFYGGGVWYVAHAILNDGSAICLHPKLQGEGGQPFNHPDQAYWRDNILSITKRIATVSQNIKRIEIDCTLMPCTVRNGCMTNVPQFIRTRYLALGNVALRIFSYRLEFPVSNLPKDDSSDHRYYDTSTLLGHDQEAAYNAHKGWGWVPAGISDRDYANDRQAII